MNSSESSDIRISLRDVLFIIFSKIDVLMGTLIIVVCITVVSSFLVSPVYEVSATVLIRPYVDSSLQLQTYARLQAIPVTLEEVNSEIKIMTSEELLRRVVLKLGLDKPTPPDNALAALANRIKEMMREMLLFFQISTQSDPVDIAVSTLMDSLEIEPVTMSNMIRISMKGKNASEIAKIVNTHLDSYIDFHIEVYKPKGGIDFYSQQADFYNAKLLAAENELKVFQQKFSIIEIQSERIAYLELDKLLRQSLSSVRSQISKKHSELFQLKTNFDKTGEFSAITEDLRANPVIVELTKVLIPLLVEAKRISLLYPETSVEYQDAFSQLEKFKEEIRREQEKIINGFAFDLVALRNEEKTINSEIAQIQSKTMFLTEKEAEIAKLRRAIAIYQKNYLLYQDKTEEARISDQKDISRVANISVAGWAYEPSTPIFPKKFLMALISIFVGFVAGIGASFTAYYLDHTVKRPEDLDITCQVPVLSSLETIELPDE